jgi:transcriptional regulator with XRE-family HTH domain
VTLAELDECAGLSVGHSGAIERGTRGVPRPATVERLATALGVEPAWLMFGGKAPKKAKAK